MPCCETPTILHVEVCKAYRTGGTSYRDASGDNYLLDGLAELPGVTDGGDIDIKICLSCSRVQNMNLTVEQREELINRHLKEGFCPQQAKRAKDAEREVRRQEREAREHLYEQWRKEDRQ